MRLLRLRQMADPRNDTKGLIINNRDKLGLQ